MRRMILVEPPLRRLVYCLLQPHQAVELTPAPSSAATLRKWSGVGGTHLVKHGDAEEAVVGPEADEALRARREERMPFGRVRRVRCVVCGVVDDHSRRVGVLGEWEERRREIGIEVG